MIALPFPKLPQRPAGVRLLRLAAALALLAFLPAAAQAQPFTAWYVHTGITNGYVQVPHNAALNPTGAFTAEAWVAITTNAATPNDCRSLIGKSYLQAYWIGVCGNTLRSYLKGVTSQRNGGIIPSNQWTHIAVVFNGSQRIHYINGEVVATFAETGPLSTSLSPFRIGSDTAWEFSPNGAIDEVRLWNVARTTAQIRSTINVHIGTAQPGLIAVWALDGNGNDVIGPFDGMVGGAGNGFFTFAVATSCGSSTATSLCLLDRFIVTGKFRTGAPGTAEGTAHVVNCPNDGSGLFWFFNADNWEVMVKAINACGLNDHYWVFSAATTNVFYRLEVLDVHGAQKIYFNYPGPPAPAVVDVNALATCP